MPNKDEVLLFVLTAGPYFTLFFFPPVQKWKPKGPALQHIVSGLCLDSQPPAGPPVITQCHPQLASQSWEPQLIT